MYSLPQPSASDPLRLPQRLLTFYNENPTVSALHPLPLTPAEIQHLLEALPWTGSVEWEERIDDILLSRWFRVAIELSDLSETEKQKVHIDRAMWPSNWDRRMHVLSQAHKHKFKDKETMVIIGIPGMVGIVHINVQRVYFEDAMRRVNSIRKRKEHNMTWLEAICCLFVADIHFRQHYGSPLDMKDLFNAYRANGHDEERLWAVKDSAKHYLQRLKEITDNMSATKHPEYAEILETEVKAYAGFCKFNDWLTEHLTERLKKKHNKTDRQNASRYAFF